MKYKDLENELLPFPISISKEYDENGNCWLVVMDNPGRTMMVAKVQATPNWAGKEKSINWETDTIIWCKNIEGARILQDAVNIVVLEFGGFKIIDDHARKLNIYPWRSEKVKGGI